MDPSLLDTSTVLLLRKEKVARLSSLQKESLMPFASMGIERSRVRILLLRTKTLCRTQSRSPRLRAQELVSPQDRLNGREVL
jgi:hypothetical protein